MAENAGKRRHSFMTDSSLMRKKVLVIFWRWKHCRTCAVRSRKKFVDGIVLIKIYPMDCNVPIFKNRNKKITPPYWPWKSLHPTDHENHSTLLTLCCFLLFEMTINVSFSYILGRGWCRLTGRRVHGGIYETCLRTPNPNLNFQCYFLMWRRRWSSLFLFQSYQVIWIMESKKTTVV